MDDTRTMHLGRAANGSWWQLLFRRTPTRPPSWHAPRPTNTRPGGGRHRCNAGGVLKQCQLPNGSVVTFRRRP